MMSINDWQTAINAIRNISKSGAMKTNENNYNRLMKFLKEKEPRINELNTEYDKR